MLEHKKSKVLTLCQSKTNCMMSRYLILGYLLCLFYGCKSYGQQKECNIVEVFQCNAIAEILVKDGDLIEDTPVIIPDGFELTFIDSPNHMFICDKLWIKEHKEKSTDMTTEYLIDSLGNKCTVLYTPIEEDTTKVSFVAMAGEEIVHFHLYKVCDIPFEDNIKVYQAVFFKEDDVENMVECPANMKLIFINSTTHMFIRNQLWEKTEEGKVILENKQEVYVTTLENEAGDMCRISFIEKDEGSALWYMGYKESPSEGIYYVVQDVGEFTDANGIGL